MPFTDVAPAPLPAGSPHRHILVVTAGEPVMDRGPVAPAHRQAGTRSRDGFAFGLACPMVPFPARAPLLVMSTVGIRRAPR